MTHLLLLLAQDPNAATTQPSGLAPLLNNPLIPLVLMMGVLWWIMSSGKRKEQKRYQEMLGALKRNDRVLTVGGVVGTVVDVRDDVVVLKVDESNNVKMQFIRSAVKDVLRDTGGEAK